jgi:hypothetical protein
MLQQLLEQPEHLHRQVGKVAKENKGKERRVVVPLQQTTLCW